MTEEPKPAATGGGPGGEPGGGVGACAAVIVAAGRGVRAGGDVPKQYARIGGEPVLRRTVGVFAAHPAVSTVVAVIHPDDAALARQAAGPARVHFVDGGASRQESVYNGLKFLDNLDPEFVLVHDAARPFVTADIVGKCLDAARRHAAAAAGVPMADTVKRTDEAGVVTDTIARDRLWRAQTPQAFRYRDLMAAHEAAAGRALTDDAAVAEAAGFAVAMSPGSEDNFKITAAEDLARADRIARALAPRVTVVGHGFDVHAFGPGDHIVLCGVRIGHSRGLEGHSDADAALHALTDALLGALGEGDIGQHFPDSDPQWRGAASDRFVRHALGLAAAADGRLINLDLTIVCERPKLQPHYDAMKRSLCALTGLPPARIGLKATTTEKLGFTGRGEGLAAQAVVSLDLPDTV
ncbi:MAG: bifunctional 2-C-methyl-D-erythritol 4-phosphate cytidylyltransferase/2-C-methyl-D-erythritol 2,4-cyclodiphosphate synthase [Rhodospirillaceae bacterium]|nr:bifunctional 2-C-methyl-D-erythritol 4-phosphate cytidylyltransferase/2-C-methyl-D-erythritol 2,4-cyclodiphosphate synthase [Rhodospirillaceae bacterium]MYB12079.1 bifunctional 2-C-methyl-D-erythritol 4-phosphate cytidylyltransferase/2-C-methyl-D-erythritol 2,4-cyclodiphosphate synthase [Rhodospirillaceae bacterium]MYI48757.1 bifunctional 2-C-methyl-D-erythritol 4-phosphate cytidylyltransferase/2-C-methyl-D-erythritol 2,4-cyclodiphosphate synthase [Rhodospirillaceae bacterium]